MKTSFFRRTTTLGRALASVGILAAVPKKTTRTLTAPLHTLQHSHFTSQTPMHVHIMRFHHLKTRTPSQHSDPNTLRKSNTHASATRHTILSHTQKISHNITDLTTQSLSRPAIRRISHNTINSPNRGTPRISTQHTLRLNTITPEITQTTPNHTPLHIKTHNPAPNQPSLNEHTRCTTKRIQNHIPRPRLSQINHTPRQLRRHRRRMKKRTPTRTPLHKSLRNNPRKLTPQNKKITRQHTKKRDIRSLQTDSNAFNSVQNHSPNLTLQFNAVNIGRTFTDPSQPHDKTLTLFDELFEQSQATLPHYLLSLSLRVENLATTHAGQRSSTNNSPNAANCSFN